MIATGKHDAQVIVVGAGPAGAATAILLAEHGLDVLILDRARFPRPKVCGEYLSPEAGRVLDRIGVLKAVDAVALSLRGMRITAPDGTMLLGTYEAVGAWQPYRQHAIAVPRLTLDAILVDRLRVLPVDLREELRVTDVLLERDQVVGVAGRDAGNAPVAFRAPIVVAADGRSSVVARRLGCRQPHRFDRMALVTYVSGLADCREFGEIFVDPPDYVILNPLADGQVNMSLVVPRAHAARYSDRLEQFFAARVKQLGHVPRRLAGAERVADVRAMGPLAYRVTEPSVGGVLLAGDAAGFYDPFTGEGMYTALRSAELATDTVVRALERGDASRRALASYDSARRAAFADKQRVTRALQFVIGRRWLANAVAHLLARRPQLLGVLMGVIGDFVPPRALLSPTRL